MRCLFCKQDSSSTKSIEHIVPESLGNKTYILPLGYVCDKCNNYFSIKIEKQFLEQFIIRLLRFHEAVPNKKNRIPTIDGIFGRTIPVKVHRDIINDEVVMGIEVPPGTIQKLENKEIDNIELVFPAFTNDHIPDNNIILSRFLAKIALESLANKLKKVEGSLDDLIDDSQFDVIRNHARLGTTKVWPCHVRRIYNTEKIWKTPEGEEGQIVQESDFLLTNPPCGEIIEECIHSELYFIIALWGIEFAINMAGPCIDGYINWLKEHDNVSPLYYGKNSKYNAQI